MKCNKTFIKIQVYLNLAYCCDFCFSMGHANVALSFLTVQNVPGQAVWASCKFLQKQDF